MKKIETLCPIGGSVKLQPLWKKYGSSKNQKLPYDPAIPFEYIPKSERGHKKNIWTPMFIAVLLTVAKRWNQLKCPSTDG